MMLVSKFEMNVECPENVFSFPDVFRSILNYSISMNVVQTFCFISISNVSIYGLSSSS